MLLYGKETTDGTLAVQSTSVTGAVPCPAMQASLGSEDPFRSASGTTLDDWVPSAAIHCIAKQVLTYCISTAIQTLLHTNQWTMACSE